MIPGLCSLVLAASSLSAQSLVEIASVERARRETIERAGQTGTTFTNVGVRTSIRRETITLACILTRDSSPDAGERDEQAYWDRLGREDRARQIAWQQRRYAHAASLEREQSRLITLRALSDSCDQGGVSVDWAWGNRWGSPSWGLGGSFCGAVPDAIRNTESAIARIRSAAYDDARRLRIPPGLVGIE
jgi:hypothetical protein